MKILLIHTEYQILGGEDTVFKEESELLKLENEVITLTLKNKYGTRGAVQFLFSIWNVRVAKQVYNLASNLKPDVIHIHNWHFASGPLFIRAIKKLRIPIVMTLHNYRLICPSGTLLYNEKLFLNSLKAFFPWQAVFMKVYRNSFFQTFWLAFVVWLHKRLGTWTMVDRFIVLTKSAKILYLNSHLGIPESKLMIKPNFVRVNELAQIERSSIFLFIGRLSSEKGINVLLDAFIGSKFKLNIAGSGPMQSHIEKLIIQNRNIKYLGNLKKDEVLNAMRSATALVFPSIWYEGMPMTIIESFAVGTPVIGSNIGAMKSMITNGVNGLLFDTGSSNSLARKLEYWDSISLDQKLQYSKLAKDTYLSFYTPEIALSELTDIYNSV